MLNYANIISPFTGGKVKEVSTTEERNYKGKTYIVHVRYYVCEDTGEQFTTTEQDQEWYDEMVLLASQGKYQEIANQENCSIVAESETNYPSKE